MRLSDFLDDVGRPVAYYPKIAIFLKSVNAAIFLCQLVYWEGKQPDGEGGWIYKKQADITEETGLSRHETDGARRVLSDLNIIATERRGVPPIVHYKIDRNALDEAWDIWLKAANQFGGNQQINLPKSGKLICQEPAEQFAGKRQNLLIHSETTAEITTETTHTHDLESSSSNDNGHASGVCVSLSKFSLEQIRIYARNQTPVLGEGWIGKARATGYRDELIADYYARGAQPSNAPLERDTSSCPDCEGSGFKKAVQGKGVAKCKHERLEERKVRTA
jgi:hypothetical protein